MQWLNLSVSDLASPTVRRSDMQDRGVWITLLAYCVQQENSGRIAGAQAWTEWDCLQVLGIPAAMLEGTHTLWHYENGDLLVYSYPAAKQKEVTDKRRAARRGNRIRWGASSDSESHSESQTDSHTESHSELQCDSHTESESESGKEGKGKERKENRKENGNIRAGARGGFTPPAYEEWYAYARAHDLSWSLEDIRAAFDHYEACGWRMGQGRGKPVADWRACVRTCARNRVKKTGGGLRAETREISNPNAGLQIFEPVAAPTEGAP